MNLTAETRLHLLVEFVRRASPEQPLNRLLSLISDTALKLVAADHASVRVLDASGHNLLAAARSGEASVSSRPTQFRRGEGVLGWVVATGSAALVNDVSQDPRFQVARGQGFPVGAVCVAPVLVRGEVIGVVGASTSEAGHFGETDKDCLRLLALAAAPFMDARRLEEVQVEDHQDRD